MPIKKQPFPAIRSIGSKFVTARFTPSWIAKFRVTQQFVEVIHSGSDNRVRVTQQFVEVIHSGSDNRVRVTQQFVEVIHTFGTPPVSKGPGNSGNAKDKAPGQVKKDQAQTQEIMFRQAAQRNAQSRESLQNRHRLTPLWAMPGTYIFTPFQQPIYLGPAVIHATRSV